MTEDMNNGVILIMLLQKITRKYFRSRNRHNKTKYDIGEPYRIMDHVLVRYNSYRVCWYRLWELHLSKDTDHNDLLVEEMIIYLRKNRVGLVPEYGTIKNLGWNIFHRTYRERMTGKRYALLSFFSEIS